MKKILLLLGNFFLVLPVTVLAQPGLQIQITFNPLASSPQSVPLSPWLYVLMAIMLTGIVYFHKQKLVRTGFFFVVFASTLSVGLSLFPKISEAIIDATTLINSPVIVNAEPLGCGDNTFYFTNGLPNGLVITNISLNISSNNVHIDFDHSTCKVGGTLTGNQQCTVVVDEICG